MTRNALHSQPQHLTTTGPHIMICSECQRTLSSDVNTIIIPIQSPVPHLLTTNDPPRKHESDATLDALAHSRADLRILDGEIAEVEKHLLRLQAKRASVQNFVDEHAGLHLRRVPEEILAMIFMFTLPDKDYPSPLHSKLAPVVLDQTCRLWRALSRAIPLLWTTIRIEPIETLELLTVYLEWIARAGNYTLKVLYQQREDSEDSLEWGFIGGIAARIEHLDIGITEPDKVALLFPADGSHGMPQLQFLRLVCSWEIESNFGEILVDLGTGAPRLSCIQIHDICTEHLRLPSSQITTCTLEVDDDISFIEFLQEAVNLVDCTITIYQPDAFLQSPVRHTKLEKLAIQVSCEEDSDILGELLELLDLPSIHDFQWTHHQPGYRDRLTVPIDDTLPEWPRAIFLDFLSRSGCMLSKLWIDSGPTEEDVLKFLPEVPSVIDLAIGPEPFDRCPRKLLQALTLGSRCGPNEAELVPNLEHLKIYGGWHEREEMVEAIESRLSGVGDMAEGRRLKKVTLSSGVMIDHGYGSRDAQEKLDEYVRKGLICAE